MPESPGLLLALCLSAFAVGCFLVIFTRGGADALPEAHGAHR